MIKFIYGSVGTGKSEYTARASVEALANGRRVILLVPEQQAVEAEQRITTLAEAARVPTVELETLNFTRLANRVFRRFGGLCYNYIRKGARKIIMWRALSEVAPALLEYGGVTLSDRGTLDLLTSAMTELTRFRVSPEAMLEVCDGLEADGSFPALRKKLHDTALIRSSYKALIHAGYDDAEEDLDRLNELLREHDFFSGYDVFIDSFNGFTPQQISILRHIFRQSDDVTLTLALPYGLSYYPPMFDTLRETAAILTELCELSGNKAELVKLETPFRYPDSEIPDIYAALWDFTVFDAVIKEKPRHIRLIECADVFAEAEAAALEISRRVEEGGRYSDNIIIVRSAEPYRGVLDAIFEKYSIPLYISSRQDITVYPAARLLLSALSVICNGWKYADIIACAKTGAMNITADESDTLEAYAAEWNINGSRWYDGERWDMNPDGYTDLLTMRGAAILDTVNDVKERLAAQLLILRQEFLGGTTVRNGSAAVFNFAESVGLRSSALDDEGMRVWNTIIDSLDELVTAAGDETVNAAEYLKLFTVVLGEADIGSIPDAVDTVTVGEAANFRAGRAKSCFLLGCVDGEFPANITDDGVFSDSDRVALETFGIRLAPSSDRRASDELFRFARALAAVEGEVTLVYHVSDGAGRAIRPSAAIERLRALMPSLEAVKFSSLDPLDYIAGKAASFELTAKYRGSETGYALREIYESDPDYAQRLSALDRPFIDALNTVSPETAKEIFGGDMALTQTRIESYVKCGFSYYCGYVLKLAEQKTAQFRALDTGSFIHSVLERFFREISTENSVRTDLTDDEISAVIDEIIENYLDSVIKNASHRTNRIAALFTRLRRTSLLLIKNLLAEFKQSKFIPCFFELPIGVGEKSIQPLRVPLAGGGECSVYGIADRVDLYKDGKKVYVRVTDYKTGAKDFSLEDLALGINLQMFLYLFAIWKNQPKLLLERAGAPNGELLPAGVLYMSAKAPEISCDGSDTDQDIEAAANKTLTRRGLLLDDQEILSAMESELSGKFIPVKLKKDGGFGSAASLSDIEGFGSLMKQITDTLADISAKLRSGSADATPLKYKQSDACKYCAMKPICRAEEKY